MKNISVTITAKLEIEADDILSIQEVLEHWASEAELTLNDSFCCSQAQVKTVDLQSVKDNATGEVVLSGRCWV